MDAAPIRIAIAAHAASMSADAIPEGRENGLVFADNCAEFSSEGVQRIAPSSLILMRVPGVPTENWRLPDPFFAMQRLS